MSGGNMPPEPPPVTSEADYINGPAKRQQVSTPTAGATPIAAPPNTDLLPIPQHLLNRTPTPALNKAVAELLASSSETVPKNGYNKHHDYKYATADDIRAYVAVRLGRHGLSYEQHEVRYTQFDRLIGVTYFFVLVHESGETAPPQQVTALARLIDNYGKPDDKAFSKVSVLALKDWSKGRFSIPTGDVLDDPDASQEPAPAQQRQPPPPRPPPRLPAKSAASEAFRNAGLPPKDAPLQNGATPDPSYVAETGELADSFLAGALHSLETETNGKDWLAVLKSALQDCPSIDTLSRIKVTRSVVNTLQNGPPAVRKRVDTMFDAAEKRLGDVGHEVPTAPGTGSDGWFDPNSDEALATARAIAHE